MLGLHVRWRHHHLYTTSTSHHTTYSTAEGCAPQTEETVTTTAAFGPAWICIGDDGGDKIYPNCSPGFPFEIIAGSVNYNTNTHTETYVCSADPAAIPTLSEWAQLDMAALLVGGGLLAIRRQAKG
ncbi:MAG: IPTL-CTERM sorting domain-containing protein [Candidatus Methylomirabilis oxygeniifera]|uniref:IPTL-CTERM protein sorting domain-containing protein n=1 Tax=Methylomirabilis oxygeniifera TaxID=671143 RepID=D5MHQ4_METO1|nr:MAG: IPTL-CTERM sorting domain-containing protein [Candidatus Methylomirabilis oxyfera]CBE67187.1 protein of unknown function [Candidatus Methylomirabilis oxyfera]